MLCADFVSQLVTIDRTFVNYDRSARSSNLVRDCSERLWIIDHGACRFLFQGLDSRLERWLDNHIFCDQQDAFDPHWWDSVRPSLIVETMAEVPEKWLTENRLSRDDVVLKIVSRMAVHKSK